MSCRSRRWNGPEPIPTEVLVRVHAAGVNPVDWKTRKGSGMAGVLGDPPWRIGWDVAGVVEEVGMGVTRFRPGDEVFGMPWFPRAAGAYADYVTCPARQLALRPEGLDFAAAAALPLAALTAWQALVDTAGLQAGQRVLVHAAAGGVGHLAVQIAKALGAEVYGTAGAAKQDFLRELGVDRPIDYKAEAFEDVATDMDVVLDLIGTWDYGTARWPACARAARCWRSPRAPTPTCSRQPRSRASAPPACWSSPTAPGWSGSPSSAATASWRPCWRSRCRWSRRRAPTSLASRAARRASGCWSPAPSDPRSAPAGR